MQRITTAYIKSLIAEQNALKEKVLVQPLAKEITTVAGCDSALIKDDIFSVFVIFKFPSLEVIEVVTHQSKLELPYIPGLLAFREIPNILKAYEKIETAPDLIMVDGHGIAHPRRLGIASHLGVLLAKPTIGIAKKKLVGEYEVPGEERGSYSELTHKGELIGYVLRSRARVKPVFVSPGHLVSFKDSLELTITTLGRYRLPEVTRIADAYSKSLRNAQPILI